MKSLFKEVLAIKRVRYAIIATILIGFIYSGINAYLTTLITNVIGGKTNQKIGLLTIIGLCIVQTIFSIIQNCTMHEAQYSGFEASALKFVKKVLYCDYNVFTKYSTDTVNTIYNSISTFIEAVNNTLMCFNSIAQFICTVMAIIAIEKLFAVPILLVYCIGATIFIKFLKTLMKLDKKREDIRHQRAGEIEKIVKGFNEVRSFSTEEAHYNSFLNISNNLMKIYRYRRKVSAIFVDGLYEVLDSLLTITVVGFAIIYVPAGNISAAVCMSIMMYVWRLTGPIINAISRFDELSVGIAAYEKYKEFMDITDEIEDGSIKLDSFNNGISIEHISFSYNESDNVINNLSLYIKKGMKLGICGTSGEGKSTFIKLLPRFYDIDEGSIKIDGIDIRKFTLKSLRSIFGVVHQKGYIFKGTIMENLKYGNPNASEVDIIEACKKASIYSFIKKLPDQLNTKLGPGALELSGGQAQRLCIARIFLQDPEIIILDEATSALDNESEQIIQDSIELFKDKTIITIAHRLSTIQNCDKIIVMDNHTIAESGTHVELLTKDGIYAKLYTMKDKK